MYTATFRFYGSLNDFLPTGRKQTAFEWSFLHRMSVKDTIESFGVPHPEVGLLLVNSQSVDFSYVVEDSDYVSVYPATFATVDVASLSRVLPRLLSRFRFVLDCHLGKLAGYLRMLGFDTLYRNDYADPELAHIAAGESRILLTRDRGLLMRTSVEYGYFVRHTQPRQQLREVVQRFGLDQHLTPFQRCMSCNGLLQSVDKETVFDQLPPLVQESQQTFFRCSNCGKIYWEGTHFRRMQAFVGTFLGT
ncbi:hypothetical protein LX87_01600 [Larkinella arboricola]|uniref:Twitching motility protein PilT n=1 Tax=Larkinella arboricola TaxID=643671 RepID=A0A327X3J4_LARAB|nr:Mut7-C RNAse domain-containing protein [Larkinella arboricola]RAJ99903.1 hypothetical protein LX87_01600 [Larkinella arboricola]